MKEVTINLDRLAEISLKGIRRTSVFMSFGINSARDKSFKDYQLPRETTFRVMPDNLSDDQIEEFKKHYEHWIISCGLRELIETFSVYLCRIYKVCLKSALHKKAIVVEKPHDKIKSFEWKGVEKQLKNLRQLFAVETSKEKYIKSINQARNCITHRRGIVGVEDLSGDSNLKITWWALDFNIETPNGEKISFNPPYSKEGIFLKDGGSFSVKVIDKEREYKIGDVIKLSPSDLSEICMVVKIATQEILSSAVNYMESIAINVIKTEQGATR